LAKTIDTSFYTDSNIFDEAKEKIFSSSWQFIGNASLVKEANSAYPFTILENYLGEPLLLTHDKDGALHCLSNVCTHRGNIVIEKPCKAANLRCKYHGRLFNNDGKFISMPEFKEVQNFPSATDDLHRLPLFNWGDFLFTALQNALPASDIF
jgi:choline monooxygenase